MEQKGEENRVTAIKVATINVSLTFPSGCLFEAIKGYIGRKCWKPV